MASLYGVFCGGIIRLWRHPVFFLMLIVNRARWCFRRKLKAMNDPWGFHIHSPEALVSYWQMAVEGECFTPAMIEYLRTYRQPLVLDVGANRGVFGHVCMALCDFQCSVHAIEPNRYLSCVIPWQQRVTSVAVGIPGRGTLYQPQGCLDTSMRIAHDPRGLQEIVALDTLEDRKVDILKIDIEGSSFDVLNHARNVLQRGVRFVVFEAFTFAEARAIFDATRSIDPVRRKLVRCGRSDWCMEEA